MFFQNAKDWRFYITQFNIKYFDPKSFSAILENVQI